MSAEGVPTESTPSKPLYSEVLIHLILITNIVLRLPTSKLDVCLSKNNVQKRSSYHIFPVVDDFFFPHSKYNYFRFCVFETLCHVSMVSFYNTLTTSTSSELAGKTRVKPEWVKHTCTAQLTVKEKKTKFGINNSHVKMRHQCFFIIKAL